MLSLKVRSVLTLLGVYLGVGLLTLMAFLWAARGLSTRFARRFAITHAQLDRERFMGPVMREVALARKMTQEETIRAMCRDDRDPRARAAGLKELEAYRRVFSDRSCFLVAGATRNHYFGGGDRGPAKAPFETLDPAQVNDRWYFDGMARIDDYELHVDSDVALGAYKVWINVVVKDGGQRIGMAGTGLDLSAFVKDIVRGGDRSTTTIMLNGRGILQAHPDETLLARNAGIKDEASRVTLGQLLDRDADRQLLAARLDRLLKGGSPQETFTLRMGGKRYLVAALPLPEVGWATLTLVNPSQVLGMRSFIPILGVLLLGFLGSAALASWFLGRRVLAPLARLTESAREVAGGRFEVALPVERDDELGQLTAAFNHMAGTVRDVTGNLERLVEARTAELARSRAQILDSVAYARLIQDRTLPTPEAIGAALPDHCLLARPRDLVGGDFHALRREGGALLLGVGDCTGHGVPGAFMSMAASAALDQVAAREGTSDPARLLVGMNQALKALLHQEAAEGADRTMDNGLDLGLLRLEGGRGLFAGARIPLWVLRPQEAEVEVVPADPHSLGYRRSRPDYPFQARAVDLPPGTSVFLFSDGLLDQNGGRHGFGFGRRRLARILVEVRDLPMAAQGAALERALADYMGPKPQRDDITFLGFRVPEGL
ncbi:MAG TPA: SpoIIE family protein phosphatase [Holophaga sp.]|nr:SpoIIE family protein phosphatase [Holophaga sp.]